MIPINEQQENLITILKQELAKENKFYKTSTFLNSVWFKPETGRFLFNDYYVRYEVIESLIENKTLIFEGIEKHQGEKMLRYVLNSK
jgi:hypothetical protein